MPEMLHRFHDAARFGGACLIFAYVPSCYRIHVEIYSIFTSSLSTCSDSSGHDRKTRHMYVLYNRIKDGKK